MQPAQIDFKPSRQLRGLVVAMGALALVAIAAASLPWPVQLALAGGLTGMLALGLYRLAKPLPRIKLAADGSILIDSADDWQSGAVLPGSFVAPALCVVRLRSADGRVHAFAVLPDSADADALRRFRLCLRWARTRSDTAAPDAG